MWFRKKTNKPFAPQTFGNGVLKSVALDEWQAFRAFYLRALKEHPTCSADDYTEMKEESPEYWKGMIETALTDPASFLGAFMDKNTGAIHGMVYLRGRREAKRSHETDMHLYLLTNGSVAFAEDVWHSIFAYLKDSGDVERIKAPVHSQDRQTLILFTKLGFQRYGFDEHYYRIGKKYLNDVLLKNSL